MRPIHYRIQRALIFTLLAIGCLASAQAATLQATVDRNQISTDETLRLSIRYDQQVEAKLLDLSPLKANFEVLAMSPQSSSSMSIVNGRSTRTESTVWTVVLAAKKTGTLTIPVFSLNGAKSDAIQIDVVSGATTNASSQPLLVGISANHDSIYLGQQLLIEIELSAASDVGDLNGPQFTLDNGDVELLGQKSFQRIDNGIARQIVVLNYAVFANQVGLLNIPTLTYTGVKGGRRSLFGRRGQQIAARSQPFEITVNSPPSKANAQWLPAENVLIESSWSNDTSTLKVGEPATRSITIMVEGQRASAIPPLEQITATQDYKSYKDQAQLDTQTKADGLIGRRIESEAIVPAHEGSLVLPEIRLPWWDVKEQQWREAVLPPETLQITGFVNSALQHSPSPPTADVLPSATNKNLIRLWQSVAALFALICLAQFWLLVSRRKRSGTSPSLKVDSEIERKNKKKAWQQLQKSLGSADAKQIRYDLLTWAQQAAPSGRAINLQSLLQQYPIVGLKTEINQLEAHLFKGGSKDHDIAERRFDTEKLGDAIEDLKQHILDEQKQSMKSTATLKPLYHPPS